MLGIWAAVKATTSYSGRSRKATLKSWKSRPAAPWIRTFRLSMASPGVDGRELALVGAEVDLARAGDLLLLVLQELLPLGQPARHPRDGEKDREHVDREAH